MDISDNIGVKGSVEITRIVDRSGSPLAIGSVVENAGLAIPSPDSPFILGDNLVVNLGRTVIAKLLGGQGDLTQSVISKVSFGTGSEPPRYDDATLSPQRGGVYDGGENQVAITTGVYKKDFASVDFPGSYLVRFNFLIDYSECNGFVIREAGLWTLDDVLFARKTFPGLMKSGDQAISMAWTIRS